MKNVSSTVVTLAASQPEDMKSYPDTAKFV